MYVVRVFSGKVRMKDNHIPRLLILVLSLLFLFSFSGCGTTRTGVRIDIGSKPKKSPSPREAEVKKGALPPHARVHGYRANYTYRYYPSAYV